MTVPCSTTTEMKCDPKREGATWIYAHGEYQ